MSAVNNIPFDIQTEIIKRVLPVKSLIRFRSVSKRWKSLIDNSEFIIGHSINPNHQHRILLRHKVDSEFKYVSIVDDDDDSFPQHKFSFDVSPNVKLASDAVIIGCSHGLVCLYGFAGCDEPNRKKPLIVVWNPSIRKSVGVLLPNETHAIGFGVCPKTSDPKIVKIMRRSKIHYEAEVSTLGSGAWRSISMNLSRKPDLIGDDTVVVVDGVIYWCAFDYITNNNDEEPYFGHRIVSFDLTSEEFKEVDLPGSLRGPRDLCLCKLRESLVVLDYPKRDDAVCDIWMMEKNGSVFTKLFNVVTVGLCRIIGFMKNGQPIVNRMRTYDDFFIISPELEVYEPGAEHMKSFGICGSDFSMASYTESLLLLNHPDSIIHDYTTTTNQ